MTIPRYMPKLAGYSLYLKRTGQENYTLMPSISELIEQGRAYVKRMKEENNKHSKLEKEASE